MLTHNPWVVLQTVSRAQAARASSRGRTSASASRRSLDRRREHLDAPAWFQQSHPQCAADQRRVLQHGVRAQRGAAHLLRRARQRGRRSAQGGERPGRPGDRHRAPLPAGLLPPGARARTAARRRSIRTTIRGSCPITPVRDADGEWLRLAFRLPGVHDLAPRVAGPRRAAARSTCSTATIPRTRRRCAAITSELYGGGAELRLQPGARARHRRLAPAAGARARRRGLPPERRARRLRRARARASLHGGQRAALRRRPGRHTGRATSSRRTRRCAAGFDRFDPGARRAVSPAAMRRDQLGIDMSRAARPRPAESRTTAASPSTWRTWPSAAARPSTA